MMNWIFINRERGWGRKGGHTRLREECDKGSERRDSRTYGLSPRKLVKIP